MKKKKKKCRRTRKKKPKTCLEKKQATMNPVTFTTPPLASGELCCPTPAADVATCVNWNISTESWSGTWTSNSYGFDPGFLSWKTHKNKQHYIKRNLLCRCLRDICGAWITNDAIHLVWSFTWEMTSMNWSFKCNWDLAPYLSTGLWQTAPRLCFLYNCWQELHKCSTNTAASGPGLCHCLTIQV